MLVQGRVTAPFQIGQRTFTHNALVITNLLHDVILGKDFLEHFKSIIILEQHTVSLHNESPFHSLAPIFLSEPKMLYNERGLSLKSISALTLCFLRNEFGSIFVRKLSREPGPCICLCIACFDFRL